MEVAKAPAQAGPVFDRADLLRRLGDDLDLTKEIIKLFLDDAPAQIERLRAAVAAGDEAELTAVGHRIRGSAANMGGSRLRFAAEAMERAGRTASAQERAAMLHTIEEQFDLLEEAMLEEWMAAPAAEEAR
jgi:HPt (histidine-containing phosphotransfer) domain-containing protein